MAFSAKDVKALREQTNVGMMDCKKALTEALFDAVELHTGLHDDSIYLTYTEFSNWGTRGTMK